MADRLGHIFLLGEPVIQNLPLHICGISTYAVVMLLIFRSQPFFSFSYYAGISGAIQAIITPDVSIGFPHFLFITYYSSHISIIIGVAYAAIAYSMKPSLVGLRNAAIFTNLYAAGIFFINYLLETNYLFLRHKPHGDSLMDIMGPWPIYIAWLEVCLLVSFLMLHIIYTKGTRLRAIQHLIHMTEVRGSGVSSSNQNQSSL
jgi:hypothetical integral membrane protein (TIGR02206 family)